MSTWELSLVAAVALVNLANALTSHWSGHKGIKKALLFVTELLSVVGSKGSPGLKLPGKVK